MGSKICSLSVYSRLTITVLRDTHTVMVSKVIFSRTMGIAYGDLQMHD